MLNIQKLSVGLLLIILAACQSPDPQVAKKESLTPLLPDKVLNVGFVVVPGVYNSELIAPMDIFHHTVFHTEPGMKVFIVGPSLEPVTSFEGLKIIPDYAFSSSDLPAIDVLVVPSAENSMSSDLQDEELISFVREKGQTAQYVMSLCDGAFVLARAGLVEGHASTTFPSDIQAYRQMYPDLEVIDEVSFVHDKNLITSAGGAKSYDPALYLSELLYGRAVARGIGKGLVIDWDLSEVTHYVASE
jgi:transcriptional regulator GlxA family with amidase domain